MSSSLIFESAIRDVLPGLKSVQSQLSSMTKYLYDKSKSTMGVLPQNEESARLHICAFLAASKLRRSLSLPVPSMEGIPLPPKKVYKLKIEVENALQNLTPKRSGIKKKIVKGSSKIFDDDETGVTDVNTFVKRSRNITRKGLNLTEKFLVMKDESNEDKGSGEKKKVKSIKLRLGSLKSGDSSPASPFSSSPSPASPASPASLASSASSASSVSPSPASRASSISPLRKSTALSSLKKFPKSSPIKSPKTPLRLTHKHSPRKSSPLKNSVDTDVTTADIVAICNILKIPKENTHRIMACSFDYKSRVKDHWGFCSGLVIVVFAKSFHLQLSADLSLRSRVYKAVAKWQRGGLQLKDLRQWVKTVESLVEQVDWIQKLGGNDTDNVRYLYTTGRMVSPEKDYLNKQYNDKYDSWIAKIRSEVKGI